MKKTPTTQPQTQTGTQPHNEAVDAMAEGGTIAHIGQGPSRGKQANIFNMAAQAVGEKVRLKTVLMQEVRQRLAESADLEREGKISANEAAAIADTQGVRLYQGRVTGAISADELSGLLGDVYGYKPKSDGKPGKTPNGLGEAIRKRIVRCVQGFQHATGGDGGRFFDGLDRAPVADICQALDNGGFTIWQAHDRFGELKSENNNRVHPAFDPKRIAGIVEKLSEEGAREKILANPALQQAYGALIDTLAIVGEVDDDEVETVEQALMPASVAAE
jgi:hypothetical protein